MKKSELLKLLEQIPEDGEIFLNEPSSEGVRNLKMIEDVTYDAHSKVWIIE